MMSIEQLDHTTDNIIKIGNMSEGSTITVIAVFLLVMFIMVYLLQIKATRKVNYEYKKSLKETISETHEANIILRESLAVVKSDRDKLSYNFDKERIATERLRAQLELATKVSAECVKAREAMSIEMKRLGKKLEHFEKELMKDRKTKERG